MTIRRISESKTGQFKHIRLWDVEGGFIIMVLKIFFTYFKLRLPIKSQVCVELNSPLRIDWTDDISVNAEGHQELPDGDIPN